MPTNDTLSGLFRKKYPDAPESYDEYLKTAQFINGYVNDHPHFLELRKNLRQHGTQFLSKPVEQQKQSESTLLFAALAIDAYLEKAPQTQKGQAALEHMRDVLYNLFEKPTKQNLDALIADANAWLQAIPSDEAIDIEQRSLLCSSMFTALSIIHEKIKSYNNFVTRASAKKLYGIDLNQTTADISTVLTSLEAYATSITQKPEPSKDSFSEGLKQLEAFIELKKQIPKLEANARAAETILSALDENEAKASGRDYAITIVQNHQEAFNTLLLELPEEEQQEWHNRIASLRTTDALQAGLFALSWVAEPGNYVYRQITPKDVQSFIKAHSPKTPDSSAKDKLRELAESRIAALKDAKEQLQDISERFEATKDKSHPYDIHKKSLQDQTLGELEQLHHDGVFAKNIFDTLKETEKKRPPSPSFIDKLRNMATNFFFKKAPARHKILVAMDKARKSIPNLHAKETFKKLKKSFKQVKKQFQHPKPQDNPKHTSWTPPRRNR